MHLQQLDPVECHLILKQKFIRIGNSHIKIAVEKDVGGFHLSSLDLEKGNGCQPLCVSITCPADNSSRAAGHIGSKFVAWIRAHCQAGSLSQTPRGEHPSSLDTEQWTLQGAPVQARLCDAE